MSVALLRPLSPVGLRASIHAVCRPSCLKHPEGEWIARILASWWAGEGVLPAHLGLSREAFQAFCRHYLGRPPLLAGPPVFRSSAETYRQEERRDLRLLLLSHAHAATPPVVWLAEILAWAALGEDHLWRDLGVWSRDDLSALLFFAFPALAGKNTHDMKWKKFFYRQMCEAEGVRLCRAPSCGECRDYVRCFGPEV